MSIVGIALEQLLYQQRQAVEALAHVGVASCQPHSRSARDRDRHRRLPVRAVSAAETIPASTAPLIRSRAPLASSISIRPGDTIAGFSACSAPIVTPPQPYAARPPPHTS